MKKVALSFLFVGILFLISCEETAETRIKAEQQKQRDSAFTLFQSYTDKKYPSWKVIGMRQHDSTDYDMGAEYYSLLLSDGKTEQTVFVVKTNFENVAGDTETRFYEPSAETMQKRAECKK